MSTAFSFQAQLVSIMDALTKTAVKEISKLVEIESKMLKIEITRGRNEIASLTEKLQLMEKLLCLAQGGRLDATVAAAGGGGGGCILGRDAPENRVVELDSSRSVIKSECPWENIDSFSESNSLQQAEEAAAEPHHPAKEQSALVRVKEEPSDVANTNPEQDQMCLNRQETLIDNNHKSPDVMQLPKAVAEHQQPLFTDRFVTVNASSPLAQLQRRETLWNPQLASSQADLDIGKSIVQHVASQSLSVLRNMKLHTLKNSAAKRFGCLQCGKSFRCFSQLEIHQRSHTGEKPFRCTLCGKRYAQKGHLYTHQRTHTGEKPYRCPICGKGFIQKCTLDMHQRTHTGEKPFVCGKCGKGFTKNCNLKKHLTLHLDPSLNLYGSDISGPTFSGTFINGGT